MIKKMLAGAALAASVAAIGAVAAPQAMAIGNDSGSTTVNGNGAESAYGNTHTSGIQSPQIGLVQGSLNKPCLGVPVRTNTGSVWRHADPGPGPERHQRRRRTSSAPRTPRSRRVTRRSRTSSATSRS